MATSTVPISTLRNQMAMTTITGSYSVSASSNSSGTASGTKSGYVPLGVVGQKTGNDYIFFYKVAPTLSNGSVSVAFSVRNTSTSAQNNKTASFDILWVRA